MAGPFTECSKNQSESGFQKHDSPVFVSRLSENHSMYFHFNAVFLSLEGCSFPSTRTGAVFLAPHAGRHLALVISGNSLDGIRDAVHLATPTIPPMMRSPFSNMVPDYVITGPRFGAQGPGGYLCTGFWGNRWEHRTDTSSCVC